MIIKWSRRESPQRVVPNWAAYMLMMSIACVAGVGIWFLAEQNRSLSRSLAQASQRNPNASDLEPGDVLTSLQVTGFDGSYRPLGDMLDGKSTILTVFHTTCTYCRETLPVWKEMRDAVESEQVRVIGLSLHPSAATSQYKADNGIEWPIWMATQTDDRSALRIKGVPTTIALSGEGTVLSIWHGVITTNTIKEVKTVIGSVVR